MSPIKILIVDDHQMIRDGIKAFLSGVTAIEVVSEANSAAEAICKLSQHPEIDVVLMDISLGDGEDGISVTKKIMGQYKGICILAMSMHDEEVHIINMLKAGATGYILKDQGMLDLIEAIKTVSIGENYFSKAVSKTLMNQFMRRKKAAPSHKSLLLAMLTKREIEILKLIAEECTNLEIADKLFISHRTVDTHRSNMILKLNVKNTAGLVRYALSRHLIDL
ncbi:response regulator [Catalinimonas niigatensis]|uniref:response regulator n=1 Tax=Catalinimonas niigatensis TaxID=1397264 RepID=UPI0026653A85|nr:response regulator transcription factor [Catalinimonas niigatensis]WPP49828.1 response regulator transcription factor [Catalinimonas niigatensis]